MICTSVNDAVSHGILTRYRLRDGDLVSIDCGAQLDGWTGDAAITFTVGTPRPGDLELIDATQQALDAGIAAAQVGSRIGDISHAIDTVARNAGCGIPADFGDHGIGRHMHEDPHVSNRGRPGRGFPLRRGLVLAIEPMLMAGGSQTLPDPGPDHSTPGGTPHPLRSRRAEGASRRAGDGRQHHSSERAAADGDSRRSNSDGVQSQFTVPGQSRQKDSFTKELEAGAAEHLALDCLDPVGMAFDGTRAPVQREAGDHSLAACPGGP